MSKYKERGPYHFVEYADKNTPYHAHVNDLVDAINKVLLFNGVRVGDHVHEVGCGEGLILYRLWLKLSVTYCFSGNEADEQACEYSIHLLPPWIQVVLEHDITKAAKYQADVVIFSDSLEHISNWMDHLEWAKQRAKVIVIAVPSARDKHAINIFNPMDFDPLFVNGWKNEYRKTRDYRHVTIWVKT
jgi:hypothetical protein